METVLLPDVQAGTRVRLRRAGPEDARQIWLWRNEPGARRNSFCSDHIPWEAHVHWFRDRVQDPGEVFLIAESADGPVGYIRFTVVTEGWAEIGIIVDPAFRGQGLGGVILHLAMRWAAGHLPAKRVLASIKRSNAASLALFRRSGFQPVLYPVSPKVGGVEMEYVL